MPGWHREAGTAARSFMDRGRAAARAFVEHRTSGAGRGRDGYGGRIMHGGIMNPLTGLGTSSDKTEHSFIVPTRFYFRAPLEILIVQSWAARNFVNIPVDDMFIQWRQWVDGDMDGAADEMEAAERRHRVKHVLRQVMRGARTYGTSLLVMMVKDAPLDMPLDPTTVRPGDLQALRVFDRYDASIYQRERDLYSPNYGKPEFYTLHPTTGFTVPVKVHHSRVIRFDGIEALTDSGFYSYDHQDWGVSELVPVILSIIQDQSFASAVAHLSQEASIPVLGVEGLREMLAGMPEPDQPTVDEIGASLNHAKSVYRLFLRDKEKEDFERVAVAFGGLADLMDRYYTRIAAAAQIPITRFMSRSPSGLNATGESDMRNYIMSLEAKRENLLGERLRVLDQVLARDAGLGAVPEYDWQSLLEMSEEEKAKSAKVKVEALSQALMDNVIDEDEYRRQLDGDPIFGDLPGAAPEPEPEPESEMSGDAPLTENDNDV